MKFFITGLIIFSFTYLQAQPYLKPGIGIGGLPADTAAICQIPYYTGSFLASGYKKGDTLTDFTLYNLNGQSLNLRNSLLNKKPVLLVGGNLTCPVYRDKVASINAMQAAYGSQVQIFVIYGVEAHPLTDTSPYFARVNTSQRNYDDNVLYRQPLTYAQRKAISQDMISKTGVNVPVYLDGPCNQWWLHYGPAPNNAYLIDTNGIVFAKHDWYNKLPGNNIEKDIRNILGLSSTGPVNTNGKFNIKVVDSTGHGKPGDIIDAILKIKNTDTIGVLIDMGRLEENIPAGWQTSMCTNICYDTEEDRDTIFLAADDSVTFYMHFYTTASSTRDSGNVIMGFRNTAKPNNAFQFRLYAISDPAQSGLQKEEISTIGIHPNPFTSFVEINGLESGTARAAVFNASGKEVLSSTTNGRLDLSALPPGIYYFLVTGGSKCVSKKLIKLQ